MNRKLFFPNRAPRLQDHDLTVDTKTESRNFCVDRNFGAQAEVKRTLLASELSPNVWSGDRGRGRDRIPRTDAEPSGQRSILDESVLGWFCGRRGCVDRSVVAGTSCSVRRKASSTECRVPTRSRPRPPSICTRLPDDRLTHLCI